MSIARESIIVGIITGLAGAGLYLRYGLPAAASFIAGFVTCAFLRYFMWRLR